MSENTTQEEPGQSIAVPARQIRRMDRSSLVWETNPIKKERAFRLTWRCRSCGEESVAIKIFNARDSDEVACELMAKPGLMVDRHCCVSFLPENCQITDDYYYHFGRGIADLIYVAEVKQ